MNKVVNFSKRKKDKEVNKKLDKADKVLVYGYGAYNNSDAIDLMEKMMKPFHDLIASYLEEIKNDGDIKLLDILALSEFMLNNSPFFSESEFNFIGNFLQTLEEVLSEEEDEQDYDEMLAILLLTNYFKIQDVILKRHQLEETLKNEHRTESKDN